jgi:NADPH:quinone reductase-like Zn-dependent oxidoreductase
LPVIPGSDISGVIEAVGDDRSSFHPGDEIFGVTNARFTGGYAQFAVAETSRIAKKPRSLSFAEAASIPVVAVTAWQMLFEHAKLDRGQAALVLGASGNVGSYAVQLAHARGMRVHAVGAADDAERLRSLGAEKTLDANATFDGLDVDAIIDTVGGELQQRSVAALKPGGVLVSAVSQLDEALQRKTGTRSVFFYVDVTTRSLDAIAALIEAGSLSPRVGVVLPLDDARTAHEMLDGTKRAPRGKIVLAND